MGQSFKLGKWEEIIFFLLKDATEVMILMRFCLKVSRPQKTRVSCVENLLESRAVI